MLQEKSHAAWIFGVLAAMAIGLSSDVVTAAEPAYDTIRGKTFVDRPAGALAADLYVPKSEGPFPGMLVVHGGAWRSGARGQLGAIAAALAENGYSAMAISYRLAPGSEFPAQLYDCQAAVRWLRTHAAEYKVDPQRVGAFGYSAGGQLVALLGALDDKQLREPGTPDDAPSARLQVVLAGGAPCDFRLIPAGNERFGYWLGGSRSAKPDNYRNASAAAFVSPDDPPMYFFHGESDELVPIISPQEMVTLLKLRGVKTELYTVPQAGHLQAIMNRDALQQGLAFADTVLKPKSQLPTAASGGISPAAAQSPPSTTPATPPAAPSDEANNGK